MMLAKSLPRFEELPRRQSRVAAHPHQRLPERPRRLKMLMLTVRVSEGQLRVITGVCGDVKENHDGSHWLKPHTIDEGFFNRMMNGLNSIPDWRLGEMAAICEYVAVLRMIEVEDGSPNASFYQGLLKTFPPTFQWFLDHPDIFPWIERFRYAIFNRVKMDRTKSPADARIYRAYNEYLKTVDGQRHVVTKSEETTEAADDAPTQTAS